MLGVCAEWQVAAGKLGWPAGGRERCMQKSTSATESCYWTRLGEGHNSWYFFCLIVYRNHTFSRISNLLAATCCRFVQRVFLAASVPPAGMFFFVARLSRLGISVSAARGHLSIIMDIKPHTASQSVPSTKFVSRGGGRLRQPAAKPFTEPHSRLQRHSTTMMNWCLMSSDVTSWHIRRHVTGNAEAARFNSLRRPATPNQKAR